MDFRLTAEQEMVVRMVRDFVQKEVAPTIRDWDRKQEMAPHILPRMGELGIPDLHPGALRRAGLISDLGLVCEELEAVDTTLRVVMSVHMGLNSMALLQWATEEQRQAFLVPQAKGEKLAVQIDRTRRWSDVAGMASTATRRATTSSTARRCGSRWPPRRITFCGSRERIPRRPIRTTV
jgi:glutaryl-CoA dehydrogenase (non-decarboxylating)